MRYLRQSTSVDVPIGPFLDDTDGKTAETALTITQPDIRLKKNGGAWAQKNAAQTLSHEENGNYEVTLDATDTNTLGLLRVHVAESGALPVWADFHVVTANWYDSMFSTDVLDVSVTQFGGSNGTFSGGRPEVNTTHAAGTAWGSGAITAASIAADAITAAKIADGAIDAGAFAADAITAAKVAADVGTEIAAAVWAAAARTLTALDEDSTTLDLDATIRAAIGMAAANLDAQLGALGGGAMHSGTAAAGATNTITLDGGASSDNNVYRRAIIAILGGTARGQSNVCLSYNGTSKVATMMEDWDVVPDATSDFVVLPFGTLPATVESIVTANWAALRDDHQVVGSMGEGVRARITHIIESSTAAENLRDVFLTAAGALAADMQFINGVPIVGDGVVTPLRTEP